MTRERLQHPHAVVEQKQRKPQKQGTPAATEDPANGQLNLVFKARSQLEREDLGREGGAARDELLVGIADIDTIISFKKLLPRNPFENSLA